VEEGEIKMNEEEPKFSPRSYEELLMGRLGKLYDAKEEGNEYLFDEVLDELEGLFGLSPELYSVFIPKKKEHSKEAQAALTQMKNQLTALDADEITKQVLETQKQAIIQWEFRSDMLDEILVILNEFQMIPYQSSIASATMGYGELTPEEEEEEIVEEEPAPAPPVPPRARIEPRTPIPRAGTPIPPPQEFTKQEEPKQSNIRKHIRFNPNPNKNE
jgi:hypothetical protein